MNDEKVIRGYVLRSVDYGENDAIVTILSNEGIISFKAKGIKKLTSKNRSSCLLYAESEFILEKSKKDIYILIKGNLITSNFSIYSSIDYMTCLGLISGAILTFLDTNTSEDIYINFGLLLKGINEKFDVFTLTLINLTKIIIESGYGLDTSCCIRCNQKDKIVSINFFEGGFVCSRCLNRNEEVYDPIYLKSLRYVFMVSQKDYFHYELDKKTCIRIIKDLMNYIQNEFGYNKLAFYDLFKTLY